MGFLTLSCTISISEISALWKQVNGLKLKGRVILEKYTDYELQKIYNGIGPDWMPDWMRALATKWGGLLKLAAFIHDVRYYEGGTKADFTAANEEFKQNGYIISSAEYRAWNPMRYFWMNRARRWGNWCQIFGLKGYNLKQK